MCTDLKARYMSPEDYSYYSAMQMLNQPESRSRLLRAKTREVVQPWNETPVDEPTGAMNRKERRKAQSEFHKSLGRLF